MSTLIEKLFNVTKDVESYEKDTTVSTRSGSYKGVSHDKVLRVVRSLLIKNRILVTTNVMSHEFHDSSNMAVASVRVTFVDVDNPEDKYSVDMFGYGLDTQDKGPGKAISYAVKYAFLKTFMMQTGDDPENDSIEREELKNKKEELRKTAESSSQVAGKSQLEIAQKTLKILVSKIGSWGEFSKLSKDMGLGEVTAPKTLQDYEKLMTAANQILDAQAVSNEDN